MVSAEQILTNYQDAMADPRTKKKYLEGINNVTESPMAKAASEESTALYLRNVQESVASGRRQANLNAVPLSRYKDNAKNKGADRLMTGAKAAMEKMRPIAAKVAAAANEAKAAAAAIRKDGTWGSMEQKIRASVNAMKRAFGYSEV